jgi:putative FmdB family regulatory protein
MPLYEYKCKHCEHEFSDVLKINDRDAPVNAPCPSCKSAMGIERLVSTCRIVAGVGDFRKGVPDVFKDRLREIKKTAGRTSTIDV